MKRLAYVACCWIAGWFAAPAAAQCTTVPNTGCPGSVVPSCSGSSQIGQRLDVTCLSNGREDRMFLLIDQCAVQPISLPTPLACVSGCQIGVGFALFVTIDTQFQNVSLPIPNDPNVIGLTFCMQCAGIVSSRACATLSPAVHFTVQ